MVELFLLAAALSADNFAVSIGYGSSNTRISPGMTALLNLFCSAALVASAQFGKRFLQSAGRNGEQGGGGLLFSYGNAENFRRTEKTQKKKAGKNRSKTGTSGKTAPPAGIWPAGGFDVGGWNCLRRLCRGSSGDRRTDLFASFAVGMAAMYAGTAIGKKTGQKNGGNGALFGGILFYLLAFLKLT